MAQEGTIWTTSDGMQELVRSFDLDIDRLGVHDDNDRSLCMLFGHFLCYRPPISVCPFAATVFVRGVYSMQVLPQHSKEIQ